jgi:hypothetical protein
MGSSNVASAASYVRNPLLVLALSLVVFLTADNLFFRSGLYSRIASPDPLPGQVFNVVHFEESRRTSGMKDILITGDSRIQWGFWTKQFNLAHRDSGFQSFEFGVAGSNEEMRYFLLRRVDPQQKRYAAIVITTAGYRVDSWFPDQADNYSSIDMLAPVLNVRSWAEVIENISDNNLRWRAMLLAAFPSHGYAADIQDLVADPVARYNLVERRRKAKDRWLYEWDGSHNSMLDFRLDPSTGKVVAFPSALNAFERQDTVLEFTRPSPSDAIRFTRRNAEYQAYWLNKTIDLYAHSQTKLIFVQVPRWPMPLPARGPIASAPDLRDLLQHNVNVKFVDEDAFIALEHPEYFHDTIHMNSLGRKLFTDLLGDQLMQILQ